MSYIGSYGTAVTGPTADTDLGLILKKQSPTSVSPAKGMISTITLTSAGSGYTLGPISTEGAKLGLYNLSTRIECTVSSTTGNGTGGRFQISTMPNTGALRVRSLSEWIPGAGIASGSVDTNKVYSIRLTAEFENIQNNLFGSPSGGYVLDNAVTLTGGTSASVVGTSATGTGAQFFVTVVNGMVQTVTPDPANLGTGYLVGDVVTITDAALTTAFTNMTIPAGPRGAIEVQGDLRIVLDDQDVTGGIGPVSLITVLDGGSGHTVADVLTLQEVGSGATGTGTITVATLDAGYTVGAGDILTYPGAIRVADAGSLEVKGLDDVQVIIPLLLAGEVIPLQFKEVTAGAGTTIAVDNATIYYR